VPLGLTQIQTGLPNIRADRLVAIATTGAKRWRQLPEVPTMAEFGHKELTATTWFGLMARSATPSDILEKIIDAAKAAHAEPATVKRLENMGFDVPAQTGKDLEDSLREGTQRWAQIVKATGFKASE